jgi:hypothetical protein
VNLPYWHVTFYLGESVPWQQKSEEKAGPKRTTFPRITAIDLNKRNSTMAKDPPPQGIVDKDKLANNQQGSEKTSKSIEEARRSFEEAKKQGGAKK